MPKMRYTDWKPYSKTRLLIDHVNEFLGENDDQWTVRQLYYQFVARGLLENVQNVYDRVQEAIKNGRRAGMIDWDRIEDRTRDFRKPFTWESPAEMLRVEAKIYDIDLWAKQRYRPEVWVEKDALVGIIQTACRERQVPYCSCRGSYSDSLARPAGLRFADHIKSGQAPILFYLGDHDPSGLDMSRELEERMTMFARTEVTVNRLALNLDQVREFNLPPNPAKETDSRFKEYRDRFGEESWELDALTPATITGLIHDAVEPLIDQAAWKRSERQREKDRAKLRTIAESMS